MNGVWWLRGANSRTEHAEWKEKSIWGTHYTEMDFLLKLHLFYMLCASRLHYSQCSTLQLGLSLGNMIFMLVLLNRTFYSRKFSGSFPLKGWQIVRRFFLLLLQSPWWSELPLCQKCVKPIWPKKTEIHPLKKKMDTTLWPFLKDEMSVNIINLGSTAYFTVFCSFFFIRLCRIFPHYDQRRFLFGFCVS